MDRIFIVAMIRYTKHLNTHYILVYSTIEVNGVKIPIRLQANINDVDEIDRPKVYRVLAIAFDRHLNFDKPKSTTKKPWWKIW